MSYNVVSGNNTWTLGKYSGTGAHVLHGIFVFSPATESVSGVIGTFDYSAESYSADYTLKAGETKVFTFQNHGKYDGANWDNWRIRVKQGDEVKSFTRADSWDQAGSGRAVTRGYLRSDDGGTTTYDMNSEAGWTTFRADMTDALVVATLAYGTDGTLNITTTSTANGHIYYVDNTVTELGTADLIVNISPCWSWVQLSSVANTAIGGIIPSSGYSSLGSAYGLDFVHATGLTNAFVVTDITKDAVTLTSVEELPANSGVILKGAASAAYSIPVKADAAYNGTNKLYAAVTAYDCAANEVYILQGGLFHLVTAASTVPAGKAYLKATDVPAEARSLSFLFNDEETTGINSVSRDLQNGEFYNLQGLRVDAPKKGLYIVNGTKVIIK